MPKRGDHVGDYDLLNELGSGGFGSVWLARDVRSNEEIALKILHPNLIDCRVGNHGPTIADRFLAEARILQKLDHPGVVRIHGVLEKSKHGIVAYAMERLVGEDLSDCETSFDLSTLLKVFAKTADTLAFLHDNDVIHRDVKAANIFITDPTRGADARRMVKLLDFGVAKEMHANAVLANTATGTFLGSIASMPPESFSRWDPQNTEGLTGAIDQWSLGVTLYHSLPGDQPFRDSTMVGLIQKIEREPPAAMKIDERFGLSAVPPEVEAIVLRCLRKTPAERFADMRIVGKALREASRADFQENATVMDLDLLDPDLLDLSEELSDALDSLPPLDSPYDPANAPAGPPSQPAIRARPPIEAAAEPIGDQTLHQPFFVPESSSSALDTVPPDAPTSDVGNDTLLQPVASPIPAASTDVHDVSGLPDAGNDTLLQPVVPSGLGPFQKSSPATTPPLVAPVVGSVPPPEANTDSLPVISDRDAEALADTPVAATVDPKVGDQTLMQPFEMPEMDDSTVVDDSALEADLIKQVESASQNLPPRHDTDAELPIRIPRMTTGGGMVQPVKKSARRDEPKPTGVGTVVRSYVRSPAKESPPPRIAGGSPAPANHPMGPGALPPPSRPPSPASPPPAEMADPAVWPTTGNHPNPSPQVSEIETTAAELGRSLKWFVLAGLVLAVILGFLIGWLVRAPT